MPLITPTLALDLAAAFKQLEPTLKADLYSHLLAPVSGTKSLYESQQEIDTWIRANQQQAGLDVESYKKRLWTEVAKDWADSLSDHISRDVSNNMAAILAPLIADIIDSHLKKASIYITLPIGTVTIGAGVSAVPNPVPIELTFDPLDPIKMGGIK
jgi:hypothetical protein